MRVFSALAPLLVVVVFVLLVYAAAFALIVLLLARPVPRTAVSIADRWRIGWVYFSYEGWLELSGVPWRRRRELRAELRVNLWDAAAAVGSRRAVAALGPVRALAREYAAGERPAPRWGVGSAAAVLTIEFVVGAQILLGTVWADAALASKAARVSGGVTLLPGTAFDFEQRPTGGFSMGVQFGPACLLTALLVFVLASRPWRLWPRRPNPT